MTAVLGLAAGCAGPPMVEAPLFDVRHRPIVLTERRALALPNAPPGTRFVRGWRFEESNEGFRAYQAGTEASIEIVQLAARERELLLEVAEGSGGVDAEVRVVGPAGELGRFALSGLVAVPLPADLGFGRVPLELEFSTGVELMRATLSVAAPPGALEIEGNDAFQSGWSAVDVVRWVEGGARLVGELDVPPKGSRLRRFTIAVDHGEGRAVDVFDSTTTPTTGGRHHWPFEVPLRDRPGLVRVRLTAEGGDSAGYWRGLRVVAPRGRPKSPPVRVPDPPRVIVVYVLDALRADHVGHLGSAIGASPCIDRLAAEGAAFTRHFSVAPNTGPATKALFTGHGFIVGRGLAASGPVTLAEGFAANGYVTASFSSNPHLSPSFGLTRGFEHVELLPLVQDHRTEGGVTINDSAVRVHASALSWLDERQDDDPLFLYLHTLQPHNPYTPPEPYPHMFVNDEAVRLDGRTRTLGAIRDLEREVSADDQDALRQRYAANLAANDAELCGLVEELERRFQGELMLVVTSDHGEELFDHDGVLHGYTLYDEMLHVPLVVWWPDVIAPRVIDHPTGTLDLHATLLSLVETPQPRAPEEGEPLWPSLLGATNTDGEPNLLFATAPGLRFAAMARSNRRKLVLCPRPRLAWGMGLGRGRTHEAEYLFDLETDPGEHSNLAGRSELEADWLWSRLQGWQATWRERQPPVFERTEVDEVTRRQLEALGYVD